MLDLDDIQGNILAGFNTNFQVFSGLTFNEKTDWQPVAEWLAARAPDVTTVSQVHAEREAMKDPATTPPLAWISLALGERVMSKSQPDVLFFDDAFRRGMIRRASPVLGDKTPPGDWKLGGASSPIDVLIVVASNDLQTAEGRADGITDSAALVGLTVTYQETCARIDDREHFGFRDGISQPNVSGYDSEGMEAGNFVFGYPAFPNGDVITAGIDPRGLTTNGALVVLRRLRQDVAEFRDFCTQEAARLSEHCPGIDPSHLQAMIVGRWPDGALVSPGTIADPGHSDDNGFQFNDDPEGKGCPFGSHIRKVNPRQGPRDVVDVPRFLRRGIPFGPRFEIDPEAERGLMFVSFQTSIVRTFEFVTAKWMNVFEKPATDSGHDMLVGRAHVAKKLPLALGCGPVEIDDASREWIIPTGGAYLFAPSRSGLAKFDTPPQPTILGRINRALTSLKDRFAT